MGYPRLWFENFCNSYDTTILTEIVNRTRIWNNEKNLSDSLTLADTISQNKITKLSIDEGFFLSDTFLITSVRERVNTDTVSLSDTLILERIWDNEKELSDTLTLTDSINLNLWTGKDEEDIISLSDTIKLEVTLNNVFSDSLSLVDDKTLQRIWDNEKSLSDTLNLSDSQSVIKITQGEQEDLIELLEFQKLTKITKVVQSDSMTLTDKVKRVKIGEASGIEGQDSVYILNPDTNKWVLFEHFEKFKVIKKQNQISEWEMTIYDITDVERVYFKEFASVLLMSGESVILKGRIQNIEYGTDYFCMARGFGMEAKLQEKELVKNGDKRVQYENVSAKQVATELLRVTPEDTGSDYIIPPTAIGLFDTDYGDVNLRFEYTNRLNCAGMLVNAINYEWWVSQSSSDKYKTDYFNIKSFKGDGLLKETFSTAGTGSNAIRTSRENDVSNMANSISGLGFGDGDNQIKTSCYSAAENYTTLADDITETSTSIILNDASFLASSGEIRIMEERVTYTGKSSNTLTGCTRGANGTTARSHKKAVYVEKYFALSSPESGSSVDEYGIVDSTLVDKTVVDMEMLELIISKFLLDRLLPIEVIRIIPDEPLTMAGKLDIGDKVAVIDEEAGIDEEYRIVGIEFNDEYGMLSMEIEISNMTLDFITRVNQEKYSLQSLNRYMQGSTDSFTVESIFDANHLDPQVLRVYIPTTVAAINNSELRYKVSKSHKTTEYSANTLSFVNEAFPSSPAVHIKVGGASISGSPFSVTDGSTYNADIAQPLLSAGTGWVDIELVPTGSDITRMRLNSSLFTKYFIKSEEE